MSPSLGRREELRWAAFALAPTLSIGLSCLAFGLLYELPGVAVPRRWDPWLEAATWLVLVLTLPLLLAVASLLARFAIRGRGFASRGERLRCHLLAAGFGAAALPMLFSGNAGMGWASIAYGALASTALFAVVFPLLYWPRLAFRRLSGLAEASARAPTIAALH
jgi:hypothetical protein